MVFDYDFIVVGGGSGGVRSARIAAELGARVALVEEDRLGGTCVIKGCVPKKLLTFAAAFSRQCKDAKGYGWDITPPTNNWTMLRDKIQKEVSRLSGLYQGTLDRAKVTVISGTGTLTSANTLTVGDREVTAKYILIAVGGAPFVPTFTGTDLAKTSDDMFRLSTFPKHLTVVGGGYIALEFAHIFAGLGAQVTLIHRGDTLLRGFDKEVASYVSRNIQYAGIDLRLCQQVTAIEKTKTEKTKVELTLTLADGSSLVTNDILFATGRRPNTQSLGLSHLKVTTHKNGAIVVDKNYQTNFPWLYAVGDCTDTVQLTPIAIRQGHTVAENLFGPTSGKPISPLVPTAIFCNPPAASCGLTEEAARMSHTIRVYKTAFTPMQYQLPQRDQKVFLKLIVDDATDTILGAHMVGDSSAEMIQCIAIAMQSGATKEHFDATIALHPTIAEEWVLLRKTS